VAVQRGAGEPVLRRSEISRGSLGFPDWRT